MIAFQAKWQEDVKCLIVISKVQRWVAKHVVGDVTFLKMIERVTKMLLTLIQKVLFFICLVGREFVGEKKKNQKLLGEIFHCFRRNKNLAGIKNLQGISSQNTNTSLQERNLDGYNPSFIDNLHSVQIIKDFILV